MKIESEFITGACNPIYNCLDIDQNFLVYGCSNQIFVSDFETQKVQFTLKDHEGVIKGVRILKNFGGRSLLLSGSASGELFLWESAARFDSGYTRVFQHKLEGAVHFLRYLELGESHGYFLCGDIEGHVLLGELVLEEKGSVAVRVLDRIRFGKHHIIQAADLVRFQERVLLALGSLDTLVHLYSVSAGGKLDYLESVPGHADTILTLRFRQFREKGSDYLLLASGGKDNTLRLAKIVRRTGEEKAQLSGQLGEKNTYALGEGLELRLESVLIAHSDSLVAVDWGLKEPGLDPEDEDSYVILTASFDFSIILWVREQGIWLNFRRLGQIFGNKHAFFHAQFTDLGAQNYVLSYTYTGAFHLWRRAAADGQQLNFAPVPAITGHYSYVTDLDWSSDYSFVVTCSQDQTTRVFARSTKTQRWAELSRPQVHGYDINSVKCLRFPDRTPERQYCDLIVSGADEKIIRLYEPVPEFLNLINTLSGEKLRLYIPDPAEESNYLLPGKLKEGVLQYKTVTEGGAQVLGLMTKQVKQQKINLAGVYDEDEEGADEGAGEDPEQQGLGGEGEDSLYELPPTDDRLVKRTLWPELNKLYGHGYEIQCLTANHTGTIIASACKSQTKDNSSIIVWNPKNYQIEYKLEFHNYTINELEFSHDDRFLASVSKDRQVALFRLNTESGRYELWHSDSTHTRIIRAVSFSHDDRLLVTGARDKKIKIFGIATEEKLVPRLEHTFKQPVTSVQFADKHLIESQGQKNFYLVVVGLENGEVHLLQVDWEEGKIASLGQVPNHLSHSNFIRRLKFRAVQEPNFFQLASCSDDHSLRITNFRF